MSRREFDGQSQSRGLRRLHRETGRLHRQVAGPLEIDTNTWRAYVRGNRPLRADMLPTVAQAFGVSLRDLNEAVGWLDDDAPPAPPGWDLRRELHEALPDDPDTAERAYLRWRHEDYHDQLLVLDAYRLLSGQLEPDAASCINAQPNGNQDVTGMQRKMTRHAL